MGVSRETILLISVGAVSVFVLLVFAGLYREHYFGFLTEFLAALLGVYLAFTIDRYWESQKKKEDRKNLLDNLRAELERIDRKLGHANLLYPRVWQSAVSSGRLTLLFSSEELSKLTKVYNFVEGIEYEAKRLRDAKEDFTRTRSPEMYQRWGRDSKIEIEKEKVLQGWIEKLLQDEKLWGPQPHIQDS